MNSFKTQVRNRLPLMVLVLMFALFSATAYAQRGVPVIQVNDKTAKIVIPVGTHYLMEFPYRVPDMWVGNTNYLLAQPIGPSKIMISGFEPGITSLTVSDEHRQMQAITVHVRNDVRDVQAALDEQFPGKLITAHPLNEGVLLRGVVSSATEYGQAEEIATNFYENVLNQMEVDGSQMVAISVKVYEVSRTKLRQLGIDWSYLGDDFTAVQSVSGLIRQVSGTTSGSGQTLSFGVIDGSTRFDSFINALEQKNLAKLLDEPTLVAENGRAAEFLSGGEVPIQVANNFGAASIEFRSFGTKLDIVPILHGGGLMTLEVRAEVSDVAQDLSTAGTPGFRVRRVNTGVRMKAGQTLALAGDYREEVETVTRGVPHLMDAPILGPLFRDTQERKNETELVFLITPKFIEGTAAELGRMPGRSTVPPGNYGFYRQGEMEVTNNGPIETSPLHSNGMHQAVSSPAYIPQSIPGHASTGQSFGHVPGFESGSGIPANAAPQTLETLPVTGRQTEFDSAPPTPEPPVKVHPQTPQAKPISMPTKAQPPKPTGQKIVPKAPEKLMNLPNPFENRRPSNLPIQGPYGFSK